MLDELPRDVLATLQTTPSEVAPPESPLAEVLATFSRDEGAHIDAVAARLGRTPAEVAESLLQLELDGWIRALPGARYVRVR